MSRRTLLEVVQEICDELDYDDIDSIGDTPEALQIARIVKTVYDILSDEMELPNEIVHTKLVSVPITATTHNQFTLPEEINEIKSLRYLMSSGEYGKIEYICYDEFLDISNSNVTSSSKEDTIIDGMTFNIRTDKEPEYYTIYRDSAGGETILFDSYDITVDVLGASAGKTMVTVEYRPSITLSDGYSFPYLDEQNMNILISDAKSRCATLYKQMTHSHAERDSRRLKIRSQSGKFRAQANTKRPYRAYGKRRR